MTYKEAIAVGSTRSAKCGVVIGGVVALAVFVACGGSEDQSRRVFSCDNINGEAINLGCDNPLPDVPVPVVDLCLRSSPGYTTEDVQFEGSLEPAGANRSLLTLSATIAMTMEWDFELEPGDEPIDCLSNVPRFFVRGRSERRLVGPDTCEEAIPEDGVCRCRGRHIFAVERAPLLRGDNLGGAFYGFDSEIVTTSDGLGCFLATEGYVDANVIADPLFQIRTIFIIFGGPEGNRTP